ncbi:DUF58 domain-containing protein [Metabacillus malikii]|uniref:Uncharacterized protein (DUF58 family) n=1 Tax=Metabacillus malikii TaxID=1504265 RepID=A0ABT9ZDE1_9BACI|nr:DUF58 domain-containing protein [Metabacillus malikii]MDQ0229954.1 uncharacterized protein (DUF58 family) [Metabacillus malikii]
MNIAWFIFITCVIAAVQSYIFNRWGLAKIEYDRYFNKDAVFAGEEIELVDKISNNKILPIPWLRLESKIHKQLKFLNRHDIQKEEHSDEFHRTLFSLLPFQKITRRHKIRCQKRGFYELTSVSLTIGDVLGLGETFHYVESKTAIIVYPEIISIDEIPLPSRSWLGDILVKRWIIDDPFTLAGIRNYTYGDSMNTVNWKATARTNSLQVNKRDTTADHELIIYVNFDDTEDIWLPIQKPELIEKAISFAASLAHYTISNGMSTGFACNSYLVEPFGSGQVTNHKTPIRIEASNGQQHLTSIYDTMAKLSMDKSISFNRFFQEETQNLKDTDVLIITSILTDSMQETIRKLEHHGNKIEILIVSEQHDLPQQANWR